MTTDVNVNIEEYRQLIVVIQQTQTSIANLQAQQEDCDKVLQNAKGMKEVETQGKNMQGAFELVVAAFKTIESMASGAVSEFAGMVAKSCELANGITIAAKNAGLLQSSLVTLTVGLGLAAVFTVITAITEAEERARQKAEELRREISDINSNNIGASELISEYEALSNKTIKTAEDTERMRDIRADLVEQYGYSAEAVDGEGRLLAGNLDIMKEQLAVERERVLLKLEENEAATEKDFNETSDRKKNFEEELGNLNQKLANPEKAMRDDGFLEFTDEDLEKQIELWKQGKEDLEQAIEDCDRAAQLSIGEMFQQIILTAQAEGEEVPEEVQGVIRDIMEQAFESGEDAETAKSWAQDKLDKYFDVKEDVILSDKTPAINKLKQDMIATIFSESGGEIPEGSADFINQLFAGLGGEDQAFLEEFLPLVEKVENGTATVQEALQFEGMKERGFGLLGDMMKEANQHFGESPRVVEHAVSALNGYRKNIGSLNTVLDKTAELQKEVDDATLDFAKGGKNAIKRLSDIKKEMNSLGQQRAAIEILKKGEKNSKEYADAMEYLSDSFDMDPSDIIENLDLLDQQLGVSEEDFASFMNSIASQNNVEFQIDEAGIVAVGKDADEASKKIAAMLNMLLASDGSGINLELKDGQLAVSAEAAQFMSNNKKSSSSKKGGGGGGSAKNTALEREMSLMEHKKAMDQLTTQEEIDNLERILNKYAKTNEEKEDIIEKLYSLRKQKAKEDLEYQKAMDQLTLREEISAIDAQIATYKAGTQARRELEKERYSLAKELQRQEYDLKVYYGQLTLKQQEQQLSLMLADYKKGTQARIDLEQELYDIQQQIRENGITRIDSVADGVIQALQNRYAEQQRIETERLEESKENWKKWGDEQVDAIQKQIDALDELTKQEDKEEQERQKRRKVASLEQQLLYETDLYNQTKLQEQLANARKELDDWLRQQEREELKASLQEQINQVQQKVEAEQEKIDKQIEANDKYYEELTKEQNLQAEAQKLLMKNNQVEILNLLKNFAPDYNLTGQSLGEQLVDGFMGKVADIEAWFGGLTAKFSQYQNQIASIATQAADEFYRTHGVAAGMQNSAAATGTIAASAPQITMIFNQPVESPTEIRREMERLAEQLANL